MTTGQTPLATSTVDEARRAYKASLGLRPDYVGPPAEQEAFDALVAAVRHEVEQEAAAGHCSVCALPEPHLIHTGWIDWDKSPCNGACGMKDGRHSHHEFRPLYWASPEIGALRICLVCAYEKPWAIFSTRTGEAVCRDCANARATLQAERTHRERLEAEHDETPCPARSDRTHCEHWYDGDAPCCACGEGMPALPALIASIDQYRTFWDGTGNSKSRDTLRAEMFAAADRMRIILDAAPPEEEQPR